LGTELLPVVGRHATVDAWLVRAGEEATLLLTNFALPRHQIETEQVSFELTTAKTATDAIIQRIDIDHANPKRHWERMGKPEYLSAAMVEELHRASRLCEEPITIERDGNSLRIDAAMPPQSVAAVRFNF
jgi:xylan 1,4-beta-xylosidase